MATSTYWPFAANAEKHFCSVIFLIMKADTKYPAVEKKLPCEQKVALFFCSQEVSELDV